MNHFCAFHRGININNTRMKMADLRAAFTRMGYSDIKTILASGNVIFSTDELKMTIDDHKERIEMALSLDFGYEAYVIMKGFNQIDAIIKESMTHIIPDGYHHYLLLSNNQEIRLELADTDKTYMYGALLRIGFTCSEAACLYEHLSGAGGWGSLHLRVQHMLIHRDTDSRAWFFQMPGSG